MAPNTLNPMLLAMLACPSDDHAPLREERHDGADTLVCTYCATRYPIDDGIPVLLVDDAVPGPNGVGVAAGGAPTEAPPAVGTTADARVSPKHASPEVTEISEPAEVSEPAEIVEAAEIVEIADVLDADDVAAPTDPRPQNPPPRTLAAALRNRVEHRLAEFEAGRGRRRGTGR